LYQGFAFGQKLTSTDACGRWCWFIDSGETLILTTMEMNKINRKINYLLGVVFLLAGFIFLAAGLWNVAGALAADLFITSAVVALFFLLLFALVAITYGLFLFRIAKGDAALSSTQSNSDRVHFGTVVTLLAFGLAPLLFVYLSGQSRELNNRRQAAFLEIRPALLQYMTDHGKVPGDLHLLVPEYLSALPEAIILNDNAGKYKRVLYQPEKNTALFCYKTGGIPAAETCYDIVNNQYRHNR